MSETTMEALDIALMGRHYTVSVKPAERESLLEAVQMVDARLRKMAERSSGGGEAVALMVALDIAHEFVTHQRNAGLDLPAYQRRIRQVAEQLDKALTQEQLF